MKSLNVLVIVVAGLAICFGQRIALAQACQDEEEMLKVSIKDVSDLVDTVKKENITDFQNHYHQKAYLSKTSLLATEADGLVTCLDKVSQDSATPKEQQDGYKTKRATYAKFKERITQEEAAVKSTADANRAKDLIAKSNLST